MPNKIMKLSQIQQSKSIIPDGDHQGGGSWGIFISPEQPDRVIKLFFDKQQFDNEKIGYDRVLGEPSLMRFANQYSVITVQLDTSTYLNNRRSLPFNNALLIPLLSTPPWERIGKLAIPETDDKLKKIGINVEKFKYNFSRIGISPWEVTLFVHSISHDIKAIDFTYDEVVLNSSAYTEK
ncbi:MAG: hypothetical protein N0E58_04715 [Candidatus Thiodiazotropha endolucinida]|uniref:Uncharacterized protein n=1 Tax=Candidatus Thiodiazotropha taylori TaxID=2792791 RepID=A0A9E4TS91_9GAMM|nr:hypothetical protein [Candidatus Thiodiazotropha taylori]MCW4235552.1 hypothetical protein [Candidatus Thiodiazotropha endolucinida]